MLAILCDAKIIFLWVVLYCMSIEDTLYLIFRPVKLEVTVPSPESLKNLTTVIWPSIIFHNDPKLIRQYCLALVIQLNILSEYPAYPDNNLTDILSFLLLINYQTLDSNSIDDAQQYIFILQQLTVCLLYICSFNDVFYHIIIQYNNNLCTNSDTYQKFNMHT